MQGKAVKGLAEFAAAAVRTVKFCFQPRHVRG